MCSISDKTKLLLFGIESCFKPYLKILNHAIHQYYFYKNLLEFVQILPVSKKNSDLFFFENRRL